MSIKKTTFPDPATVRDPEVFTAKLIHESDADYTAFITYLSMVPPRSLVNFRKKFPELHKKVKSFNMLSNRNQWSERARGYDVSFARSILRKSEQAKEKIVLLMWHLMEKAGERSLETVGKSAHGAVSKSFFEAVKAIRLMTGEATERNETKAISQIAFDALTPEELEAANEIRKKLEKN